jgi:outer membrane receptor protein involved in Fe transport
MSLSGSVNKRDGFADAPPGIPKLNDKNRFSIRAQALYEPTDSVSLRLIADYADLDESCCVTGNIISADAPTSVIEALGGQVGNPDDPFAYEGFIDVEQENKIKDNGISLHNNERGFQDGDIDLTSAALATGDNTRDIETFSQEFRLTSTTDGRFDWMLGAYIFQEEIWDSGCSLWGEHLRPYLFARLGGDLDGTGGLLGTIEGITGMPGEFFAEGTQPCGVFTQDNDAFSLFGTIDYHLNDSLTATIGVNYTEDDKDVTLTTTGDLDAFSQLDLSTLAGGAFAFLRGLQLRPPKPDLPNAVEENTTTDEDATWLARLSWEINDDLNVYASAATGFKSSSWDLSGFSRPNRSDQAALEAAGLAFPDQQYATRYSFPEQATVYELGLKARFDKGSLNVAIFDQKIEDFQTRLFDGVNFVQANAGQLSSEGIEFDALYAPNEKWQFTLAATYLDPVYDDFANAPPPFGTGGVVDRSGTQPGGIHDLSATTTIVYNLAFDNGMNGYLRAEYLYERDTGLSDTFPDIPREVNTANASAGLDINDNLSAQLWARNIFDDEYFTGAFTGVAQTGTVNSFLNEPRTYGLSVSYQFD